MARIKKNDTVLIISGRDKGKKGVVIDLVNKKDKILVQGVNIVVRHAKARKQGELPGIKHEERPIDCSNAMLICPSCKKACRVGAKKLDNGRNGRICASCKENI